MALRQQRKNYAPSSRNPSPNGSSPTPSSSSTPFPAPLWANLRKSPSASNSQIGSGTNRTRGTPLAAAIGADEQRFCFPRRDLSQRCLRSHEERPPPAIRQLEMGI